MADQASVRGVGSPGANRLGPEGHGGPNGNGSNGSGPGVVGSIAVFGNDVASLIELQAKLAALDVKESTGRAVVPVVLTAAAGVLVLAGVPVALLGVADLLAPTLGVSAGVAKLITAAVTFVVAGLIAAVSVRSLSRSFEPLRRSREELTRNLAWLKTVLLYSGRPAPKREV